MSTPSRLECSLPLGETAHSAKGTPASAAGGMACRTGCGACCIAPSISSPIPGMPHGKPAGVRCAQLDEDNRCKIFGQPERPAVCASLIASPEMCGESRDQALRWLGYVEKVTAP